jgi:HEAT repeat protein
MKTFALCLSLMGLLFLVADSTAADPKKEDVPKLLKNLKSRDAKVRIAAAKDLGMIGAIRAADAQEAVPVLFDLLKKERNAEVRKAYLDALGQMDPEPKEAVPAFKDALSDRSPVVRIAAAGALGRLGKDAEEAIPDLEKLQKDKDKNVIRAASMALRSIRDQKKKNN